jgi:cobalt/nickel transport system permease protein
LSKLVNSIVAIRSLDDLALRDNGVNALNPLIKLLVVIIYIIFVVSPGRYDIAGLLPFAIFPIIMIPAADIPARLLAKRLLVVLPFIVLIGVFNPVFDREPVIFAGVRLAGGWITFASLLIKGVLTVTAGLLLIATTGMENLSAAFRQLRVPRLLVLQLLLTYRYITVLLEEANNTAVAYSLRAPLQKGIQYKVWGSFAGQLLLRTYDRAQRLYAAMQLRGFEGEYHTGKAQAVRGGDLTFLIGWVIFFIAVRILNFAGLLGNMFT